MKSLIYLFTLFIFSNSLFAQEGKKYNTGTFSGIFTTPLSSSTVTEDFYKPGWNVSFQSIANEQEDRLFHVAELKEKMREEKLASIRKREGNFLEKKTRAVGPTIGTNFKGNELNSFTPNDNTIAVSNGGKIVSCVNQGIAYYDTAGNTILPQITWPTFVNNASLDQALFDPRVIYDRKHDRFITVMLHGYSSGTSKIIVSFSKTNDPMDGWNVYQLSGNPYNDTSFTDYPTIGISDDDLFVSGNRFKDFFPYDYVEAQIYQVGLAEGYAGTALQSGLWHQISTPDSLPGVTLYPASHGMGGDMSEKMYFVQLMPDSGSHVYLFEINGKLSSTTKTISSSQYSIPHFETCANAYEKDLNSGVVDSLSTGAAWTANAFYVNHVVHFCFCANIASGWCGLHYGRIYLDSNKAVVNSFGQTGTDMCYPAIAAFGYDSLDKSAVMAFQRADTTTLPEADVVAIDDEMGWSSKQTVKTGDTSVNIIYPPDNPPQPERWGDYTGICRKYNSGIPQAWMGAGYGANALRKNSFGTWIAQITTNEFPVATSAIIREETNAKIFPNPVSDMFTLEFKNEAEGDVTVIIYDMNGKIVKDLFHDFLKESFNRLTFNKLMLVPGNYVVRVTRNSNQIYSSKLSVQ